jgi:RIP metalloprotease RseP
MSVVSVFASIAVLAILIVVHELGHFLAARWQNIRVNRFSIGFGPILWKYQGSETEYAIRGFPLGGFVGFPDDDPDSNIPPNDPNLLRNRPIFDRAIVISAGVIANLIFAYLLLVFQIGLLGVQELAPGVSISQVSPQITVATKAGIKPGDLVLAVNGETLGTETTAVKSLQEYIQTRPNQSVQLLIKRDNGVTLTLNVTPEKSSDGKGRIGVQLVPNSGGKPGVLMNPVPEVILASDPGIKPGDVVLAVNGEKLEKIPGAMTAFMDFFSSHPNEKVSLLIQQGSQKKTIEVTPTTAENQGFITLRLAPNVIRNKAQNIGDAFNKGATEFQNIFVNTWKGFGKLITNFQQTADQLSGPVAIVAIGADIAKSDGAALFQFAAIISINLAIINILPLPALDGGQLVFLLIEGLLGKPLPNRIQEGVMQTGLILLLGLGIILIVRDTAHLEWVQKLFQQ